MYAPHASGPGVPDDDTTGGVAKDEQDVAINAMDSSLEDAHTITSVHKKRITAIDNLIASLTGSRIQHVMLVAPFVMGISIASAFTKTEELFQFKSTWARILYHWCVPIGLYTLWLICEDCVLRVLLRARGHLEHVLEDAQKPKRPLADPGFAVQGGSPTVYIDMPSTGRVSHFNRGGPTAATPSSSSRIQRRLNK